MSRVLARVIDGTLSLFVLLTAAGIIAMATRYSFFYPALFGFLLAYFAIGSHYGGTLGERLLSLRVVDTRTGGRLGITQSIVRAIGSIVLIASGVTIFMFGFSDEPTSGYSATALWIFGTIGGLFVLSIIARLWMLVDRQQRTLTDRLASVAVLNSSARERRAGSDALTSLTRG